MYWAMAAAAAPSVLPSIPSAARSEQGTNCKVSCSGAAAAARAARRERQWAARRADQGRLQAAFARVRALELEVAALQAALARHEISGQHGQTSELTGRLALVAPMLERGIASAATGGHEAAAAVPGPATQLEVARRNVASHCFQVPAAAIALMRQPSLNRAQRGGCCRTSRRRSRQTPRRQRRHVHRQASIDHLVEAAAAAAGWVDEDVDEPAALLIGAVDDDNQADDVAVVELVEEPLQAEPVRSVAAAMACGVRVANREIFGRVVHVVAARARHVQQPGVRGQERLPNQAARRTGVLIRTTQIFGRVVHIKAARTRPMPQGQQHGLQELRSSQGGASQFWLEWLCVGLAALQAWWLFLRGLEHAGWRTAA